MTDGIRNASESTFQADVLASPEPVLVDFWAEWCPPCRMIAPVVEQVAARYAGRLRVAKVDIDANPGLASRYHVRGIPTLMLFAGGRPVATRTGAMNAAQLAAFVEDKLHTEQSVEAEN